MFEIRKIKKDKWLIILLVGLLLVVIAMPVSDIKSDQTQDEQQMQKAEMKLNELADEVKIFGVRGVARIAKGTPSKKLQRIAVEIDASMIVIAKTGAGLVKGLPLGSTAQNLALNTNRPLLMLPEIDDI